MSEREFEVSGVKFKLNKLDAFKQFHIVRRLGPILSDIIPVMKDLSRFAAKSELSEELQLEAIAKIATPVLNGLAKLSDEDANTVLLGLCSGVEMHQPQFNSWAFIVKNNQLLFPDILELPILMQAAVRSFAFNLQSFFALAPQALRAAK